MNCEQFRDAFDKITDTRKLINKIDLSPVMMSHLEKCGACSEYFETMNMVQQALASIQREKIPTDLYWRLIKLGEKHDRKNWVAFLKPVALNVLKILSPVLPIWIISLFLSDPTRTIIEMLILIFGLALMFEKTGRSLITNRI